MTTTLTGRFDDAFKYAHEVHKAQVRNVASSSAGGGRRKQACGLRR